MTYLSDYGIWLPGKQQEPLISVFNARFKKVVNRIGLTTQSCVLVIGSYYGWKERMLFHSGVSRIATVEPHPLHIKYMQQTLDDYNQIDFKTPFQKWWIVEGAVHNTHDEGCKYSVCWDNLYVPRSSTAFSTVEKRGYYKKLQDDIVVKKYRLVNVLKGFADEGIRFTHILADYDGVAATFIDDHNPELIADYGINVTMWVSNEEQHALTSNWFDKLQEFYTYNNYQAEIITLNFISLKEN